MDPGDKDEKKKTGDDCWEGRTFVGKNEYDTHVLPNCSEVEEGRAEPKDGGCFDDEDYPDLSEEEEDRISEEAEEKDIGGQPEDYFCDYDQNCEWTKGHYPLPLYANSKILTIYRGNKNYLLPAGIIEFS
jgi:hypothetical protein